jgi:hypothetical protein
MRNLICIVLLSVLLTACSSAPKGPAPGTPAFNWLAAQDAYKNGDYVKANDILTQLAKSDNEYSDRARPWALIVSQGLASAYLDLAGKFEEGAKRNRSNPTPFRRQMADYNSKAVATALQYVETAHHFLDANKAKDVTLALDFPKGSLDEPAQLKKISAGQPIPDAEMVGVENEMLKRGVLSALCKAVDAKGKPEKAQAMFQQGEAKVPGNTFVFALANGLYEVSEFFGPKKLDQPHRIKVLFQEASEALALIPANKETKDLSKKIADTRKKLRLT